MSQRSVESILGRLVTDGRFRNEFFEEPVRTSQGAGFDLSHTEMRALLRIDEDLLVALAAGVDARMWREHPLGDEA